MKKIINNIIVIGLIVLCVSVAYSLTTGNKLGRIESDNNSTMIGSVSNLELLPDSAVFANSTTTVSSVFLNQRYITSGVRKAIINIAAIGGTSTSTMFVRQMGSFDGTNYFDIATTTDLIAATSTMITAPKAIQWDPGTSTSTMSVAFDIDGYKYTRFVTYGEDVSTDPNDGVQAWMTVTLVEDYK